MQNLTTFIVYRFYQIFIYLYGFFLNLTGRIGIPIIFHFLLPHLIFLQNDFIINTKANSFSVLIIMINKLQKERNMNQQQKFNRFYQLFAFNSSYSFFKGTSSQQNLPETSIFTVSASSNNSLESRINEELDSPSFETRLETSIILQSSTILSKKTYDSKEELKKVQNRKACAKKANQKESRNVASNLLRIFLKNVIQTKVFDKIIIKIIESRSYGVTCHAFHQWLNSFGINFKNYIRFTEIRRLYIGRERSEMHSIFRILLRQYTKDLGLSHTLTSKRIERISTPMHLVGLRSLPNQLGNL